MSRTNTDIDDATCQAVMERYQLPSKREAANYSLRLLAAVALDQCPGLARIGLGRRSPSDALGLKA